MQNRKILINWFLLRKEYIESVWYYGWKQAFD